MVRKIGVLGAGHLGKIHISNILTSDCFELTGFFDPDPIVSEEVASRFEIKRFDTAEQLIAASEMVDIVTPTVSHYECASMALRQFKHVFIEKPLTTTLYEAKKLISLAREADVKVQVGHVERFNPAFLTARDSLSDVLFVETHRLAPFNPRGTDVPVILDLMIHDIDILLHVVKSDVKKISANGVAILSGTPDIANARIEFNNGCVANLTASRMSMKKMRKSRFFQKNGYISIDFLNKEVEMIRMGEPRQEEDPFALILDLGEGRDKKQLFIEKPEVVQGNAILTELEMFHDSIVRDTEPIVSIMDGYQSLELAYQIMEKIDNNIRFMLA